MHSKTQTNLNPGLLNDAALKELGSAVKTIKYGQILVTVHSGRIVQMDKTEKIRFDAPAYFDKGDGI